MSAARRATTRPPGFVPSWRPHDTTETRLAQVKAVPPDVLSATLRKELSGRFPPDVLVDTLREGRATRHQLKAGFGRLLTGPGARP